MRNLEQLPQLLLPKITRHFRMHFHTFTSANYTWLLLRFRVNYYYTECTCIGKPIQYFLQLNSPYLVTVEPMLSALYVSGLLNNDEPPFVYSSIWLYHEIHNITKYIMKTVRLANVISPVCIVSP